MCSTFMSLESFLASVLLPEPLLPITRIRLGRPVLCSTGMVLSGSSVSVARDAEYKGQRIKQSANVKYLNHASHYAFDKRERGTCTAYPGPIINEVESKSRHRTARAENLFATRSSSYSLVRQPRVWHFTRTRVICLKWAPTRKLNSAEYADHTLGIRCSD